MPDYIHQLDATNKRGFGVRVSFELVGERFRHTIIGIRPDRIDPVAESVDDDEFEGWPLSPPIQEVREVSTPDGARSLLMIGAAAYGHWSASVQAGVIHHINPCVEFDVAVRLSRQPAYLGAAYEILKDGSWEDAPSFCLVAGKRETQRILITAPSNGASETGAITDLLKAFPADGMPNRRLFLPAIPLPKAYPASYRWRYIIAAGKIR